MEHTISRLEYTLKDSDVKANEELVILIHRTIGGLRQVLADKYVRWEQEEKDMGDCPCGNCGKGK